MPKTIKVYRVDELLKKTANKIYKLKAQFGINVRNWFGPIDKFAEKLGIVIWNFDLTKEYNQFCYIEFIHKPINTAVKIIKRFPHAKNMFNLAEKYLLEGQFSESGAKEFKQELGEIFLEKLKKYHNTITSHRQIAKRLNKADKWFFKNGEELN